MRESSRSFNFATTEPALLRPTEEEKKLRGDIKITGCSTTTASIIADVSVTSVDSQGNNRVSLTKLGSAARREKEKHGKYFDRVAQEYKSFVPLVLENHGAFGTHFLKFLDSMRLTAVANQRVSQEESKKQFAAIWIQKIAICQRRWVARAAFLSFTKFRPMAEHLVNC